MYLHFSSVRENRLPYSFYVFRQNGKLKCVKLKDMKRSEWYLGAPKVKIHDGIYCLMKNRNSGVEFKIFRHTP